MRAILTFAIIIMLSAAMPAAAQDTRATFLNNPQYNKMARAALRDKSPYFDFMQFRIMYSQTSQYDPIGEDALQIQNDLAYIVLNDNNPERVQDALFAYQAHLSKHLAHIGVVMQALSLAREDKRFGKPEFFEWLREGLVKTIMISGDGHSLSGAYDVITLPEETVLLARLNEKPLEIANRKEGFIHYNIHTLKPAIDGRQRTIFVNTSIPMRVIEAQTQERERNQTIDIRKK